eukprot:CAMPEP_0181338636 /NCGR_PEP_ID=MMETSP1101-20121128/28745_1 /TAXON_ID=46948 /ORGANISM="Rhodomonas abbreviata, Strain Caron Lab Isolate" /LENGTH=141 /DNA_ID=CAMNT_0023449385 /DNA_START=300 /DNA_END=722 /DNA_ORIENTATION=-
MWGVLVPLRWCAADGLMEPWAMCWAASAVIVHVHAYHTALPPDLQMSDLVKGQGGVSNLGGDASIMQWIESGNMNVVYIVMRDLQREHRLKSNPMDACERLRELESKKMPAHSRKTTALFCGIAAVLGRVCALGKAAFFWR